MIDRNKNTGFTVVELIVALSISAVTLLSGYELFEALKDVGDRQSAELAARARILHGLDRIRDDLWHALARSGSSVPIFTGASPAPETWTQTTAAVLEFYTLGTGYGGNGFQSLRRIQQVRYELAKDKDSACLYRKATPVVGAGPRAADEPRELILENVTQITLAFHNGQTFEPTFSSKDKLPAAVELTVLVGEEAWPLSVCLPCGAPEGQP
jgi:type II secretion system protein J